MVPNEYVEPPPLTFTFGKNILMPSIVLIALRNISAGEELYLNYRLVPHVSSSELLHFLK